MDVETIKVLTDVVNELLALMNALKVLLWVTAVWVVVRIWRG